jgi:hypothetical protein
VKRVILLSSLTTSAIWVAMTLVSIIVIFPAIAGAQPTRLYADEITMGPDGSAQIHAGQPPNTAIPSTGIQLVSAEGTVRASINTGSPGSPLSPTGMNLWSGDGKTVIARLGSSANGVPSVYLADNQGKIRYRAILDEDGNASIQLLDAGGNVIWSAP